ncbi:MAG: hypothetical protein NT001_01915 [Candidatus Woesearchaeota archaeon]|nr:hypothetical protein [Candidatus Woesearchaeota archaeon]
MGLALVLLLIIPICHSQDDNSKISINVVPIKNRIMSGEWAMFDVYVTNKGDANDVFIISTKEEGVEWSVITESTYDYTTGMTIWPGETAKTRILITDKNLVPNRAKPYSVELDVKSINGGLKSSAFFDVFLLPPDVIPYESDINATYTVPRFIDPRNIYSFKVNLFNNNYKDIKSLKINLDSALFTKEAFVELEPKSSKAVDFTVAFDENTKPTIDTLTITVTEGSNVKYRATTPIEIVAYRMPFNQEERTDNSFLREITYITLTNKDNVEEQQTFMVTRRLTDLLFTKTSPDSNRINKNGKDYFAWDVKLAPDESSEIKIDTDYRPLFYSLIAILLFAVLYIYIRDPISIIKDCDEVRMHQGGISEVKIIISLKNRKDQKIRGIRIVDMIPHMAQVDKEKKDSSGTIAPNRVINTKKGIALEWKLDMDPKEERVISYYIKSRLTILGGISLAPTVAFMEINNRKYKVRSNRLSVVGKA